MGWLFPSTVRDEPLTNSTVEQFIKEHAHKLGLPEGVTPHTMRHCFACHALEDGVSHTFIQQLLGHRSPNSTDVYLQMTSKALMYTWEVHRVLSVSCIRGSNLSYHPHIHALSTCGGLDAERNWHQKKDGFFLPGKAMAMLFKGKFLSGLKGLHDAGKLCYEGEAQKYRDQIEYQKLLDFCYEKNWVTDIRESFAGAETVMHYLGRYTHRIAISNSRILRMDESTVTIRIKDYTETDLYLQEPDWLS